MDNLRAKSLNLTGYLEYLLLNLDTEIITPGNSDSRGAQLSIRVKGAERSLFDKISDRGVIADWRAGTLCNLRSTSSTL